MKWLLVAGSLIVSGFALPLYSEAAENCPYLPDIVHIEIDERGMLYWNGVAVDRARFASYLLEASKKNPLPWFKVYPVGKQVDIRLVNSILEQIRDRHLSIMQPNCEVVVE